MKIEQIDRLTGCRNLGLILPALALACFLLFSRPVSAPAQTAPARQINWHAMGAAPCIWPTDETALHMQTKISILRANGLGCYVALLWGEGANNVEHRTAMDLSGLKKILPQLNAAKITTWVALVPPSEGGNSEPYKTDYVRWMRVLARLSVKYPHLRGINIDDYQESVSRKTFTPAYTCAIYHAKQAINPKLQFAPTVYSLTPEFVQQFGGCIDGVWLWWTKLNTAQGLADWLKAGRQTAGNQFPVYSGVYAHSTSWHRKANPAPSIFAESLKAACQNANGALIWRIDLSEPPGPLLETAKRIAAGESCGNP